MENDNIKIDIHRDVHGSVIDKSKNKKIYINKDKKEKDYWWIISFGLSILVAFLLWYFNVYKLDRDDYISIGIVLCIILFIFNPKRRFMRAAWIVLSSMGVFNLLSLSIVGNINIKENMFMYDSVIKFTEHSNIFVSFGFFALAAFLFWLDKKEG